VALLHSWRRAWQRAPVKAGLGQLSGNAYKGINLHDTPRSNQFDLDQCWRRSVFAQGRAISRACEAGRVLRVCSK